MKKLAIASWQILTISERRKIVGQVAAELLILLLDIGFLLVLVCLVGYFTTGNAGLLSFTGTWLKAVGPVGFMGIYCLLYFLKNAWAYYSWKKQNQFVYEVAARLSEDRLRQVLQVPYLQHVSIDSSVRIRQVSQQPIEFGHYVIRGWFQIAVQLLLITIMILALLIFRPLLFAWLLPCLSIPVYFLGNWLQKQSGNMKGRIKQSSEQSLQFLQEALNGYVEGKVYSCDQYLTTRYHQQQKQLNYFLAKQQAIQGLPGRLMEVLALAGIFLLVLLSHYHWLSLSLITIGSLLAALYKFIPGLVKMLHSVGQIRAYAFILQDLPSAHKKKDFGTPRLPLEKIESLALENICLSYQGKKVLEDFDLRLIPGQLTGLSGFSGRGKTSIVNVLLGLVPPSSGTITVNGHDIKSYDRAEWWKHVSYIRQQPFFLHDTVLNNIVMGNEPVNQLSLERATGMAGAAFFSSRQLGSVVRENGKNLSGGQRQRIALARALYKPFDLLILDEPFSELDEAARKEILTALHLLARTGKMILLITHDADCLKACDTIIEMEHAKT
jgi:ABC-type multidrug transport system fused ATPase/permease subunit